VFRGIEATDSWALSITVTSGSRKSGPPSVVRGHPGSRKRLTLRRQGSSKTPPRLKQQQPCHQNAERKSDTHVGYRVTPKSDSRPPHGYGKEHRQNR
jgi:hypothetical protein